MSSKNADVELKADVIDFDINDSHDYLHVSGVTQCQTPRIIPVLISFTLRPAALVLSHLSCACYFQLFPAGDIPALNSH